jgi:MazG family protein
MIQPAPVLPKRPDEIQAELARVVEIVARLRGEGGCPWDRAQTAATLRPYVIEEAYEVVEAIDGGDPSKIKEELGDLLFQVVLQSRLGAETGAFDLGHVAKGLADKLVRRHPHVFGEERVADATAVVARWEELKREERAQKGEPSGGSILAGVPVSLPALARAQKVQERAARVGFDWRRIEDVLAKLDEERGELASAIGSGDTAAIEHELGDVLFSAVNLARFVKVGAEDALRRAVARFTARFQFIEAAAARGGRALTSLSLEEMDALWNEAKRTGL